jgi:hypothetical protein
VTSRVPARRVRTAAAAAFLLCLSACGLAEVDVSVVAQRADRVLEESAPPEVAAPPSTDPAGRQNTVEETSPVTTVSPDADLTDEEIATILADLEADGFCAPSDFEEEGIVTAIHFVVQGQIQDPCYVDQRGAGDDVSPVVVDDDPRLIAAWESLASIAPIELVDDISLVVGYEPCATCSTLAFVTTLDEESTFFIIAVDVVSGADDPDELRLTMMHELTHVFAQRPGEQLIVQSQNSPCDTFYNGIGCFTEDAYLWAWIQEFWPAEIRDTLPADGGVGTDEEADERCAADAGYTGSYAAVHPEEDFAETFSAYVFDIETDPALTAKYQFFDRYPEFVSIRENARAAGLSGIDDDFDGCGY